MAVIRVNKTKDYTVMSNIFLKEKEMSLKAKGLLALMFSLPDDWDYSIKGLVSICKENETAIKSTLKELKEFNYLRIVKLMPDETESGRIEYRYDVFETPQQDDNITRKINNHKQSTAKQQVERQYTENQYIEKQDIENQPLEILSVENPLQLNTNILNTKESNTKGLNTNKQKADSDVEISEECKSVSHKVIEYLNQKANTSFKPEYKPTLKLIQHRLSEGFTVQDFITVIDNKYNTWIGTEFQQYLRPLTLFGEKFESYLVENKPISSKGRIQEIVNRYEIFTKM